MHVYTVLSPLSWKEPPCLQLIQSKKWSSLVEGALLSRCHFRLRSTKDPNTQKKSKKDKKTQQIKQSNNATLWLMAKSDKLRCDLFAKRFTVLQQSTVKHRIPEILNQYIYGTAIESYQTIHLEQPQHSKVGSAGARISIFQRKDHNNYTLTQGPMSVQDPAFSNTRNRQPRSRVPGLSSSSQLSVSEEEATVAPKAVLARAEIG